MKRPRGRGRNLKTNNGRSFTQQRIQNLLVSNKPIGSVITFTRILVLIIVNVQAFVDRCKNVKRCASNTRLFPMISHRHWWWYCITSYSINPSWSPFLSHFFLFLNNFLLYSNFKKTQMIKFWGTNQTKITKDGKWGRVVVAREEGKDSFEGKRCGGGSGGCYKAANWRGKAATKQPQPPPTAATKRRRIITRNCENGGSLWFKKGNLILLSSFMAKPSLYIHAIWLSLNLINRCLSYYVQPKFYTQHAFYIYLWSYCLGGKHVSLFIPKKKKKEYVSLFFIYIYIFL